MEERETDGVEGREEKREKLEEEVKDVEKGEEGFQGEVVGSNNHGDFHVSRMQRLNPSNPLRIAINSATRVGTPSPSQPSHPSHPSQPTHPSQPAQPRSTPTPLVSCPVVCAKRFAIDG